MFEKSSIMARGHFISDLLYFNSTDMWNQPISICRNFLKGQVQPVHLQIVDPAAAMQLCQTDANN